MNYLLLSLLACSFLCIVLVLTRDRRFTVQDSFAFFFLLQYGPHSLILTQYTEFAIKVSTETEQRFQVGMSIAYVCLAITIGAGSVVRSLYMVPSPVQVTHTASHGLALPIGIAFIYVCFFAALQGGTLEITREYIKGFLGNSFFDFRELRRELYVDTVYVRVASLTRQTTTALLFSWLVTLARPLRPASIMPILAAAVVFLICAFQMNKFPFAYFLTLAALTVTSGSRTSETAQNLKSRRWALPLAVVASFGLLFLLYRIQYRDSDVSTERLNRVVYYRIFLCASDTLRLWFDYFPDSHPFLGLQGVPALSRLSGETPINATHLIPEHYAPNILTTFQTGFIGSGQAVAGYWGVALYSALVGSFVSFTAWIQCLDRGHERLNPFWNVLLLNMLFFSTRELHTALLSGGTASVLILLFAFRRLPRLTI